ncbi:MAG: hypothetical protein KDE19_23890 [Caldilineaceae bacterium]|nr:hypothetical protein [Caldilineaceae bacterium]
MELEKINDLLKRFYSGTYNPHEVDPSLDARIRTSVRILSNRVATVTGTVPEIRGPANMDSYHLITWPLQSTLPSHPAQVDILSLSTSALYLTARVSHFAFLAELSWLELGHDNVMPFRHSAELFDETVLASNPKRETVALTALETADEIGFEVLSWEILHTPAPPDLPRQFWMPDHPEIRNYLFPGFFETWPDRPKR